jgi:hypothetical protein
MRAQEILDYWYGRAKCEGNVGGASAAGEDGRPPIVVAAARSQYLANLPQNMKNSQGVSFGLPIDFGCARIDLSRCRDFGFLSTVARRACTDEWSRIRKMRRGPPKEGDKVEARRKGSGKHYPDKIERDNGDGTFGVKFDDGDRDKNCPADHIMDIQHAFFQGEDYGFKIAVIPPR